MKNTADFYNKTAQTWADSGYNNDTSVPSMFEFAKQYPGGSRFLDLCCGCGYETKRLCELGYEAIGIDFSEESIAIAKEKNPAITFYNDDMLNDYSYIGKVHAVFIIAGLVHIDRSQLRKAFANMRNVLNDDGKIFITIYEGDGKIPERSIRVIDGVEYDRNFVGHSLETLKAESSGLFDYVEEVDDDGSGWHNYIFSCANN